MKKGLFVTTRHTSPPLDPTELPDDRAYLAFRLSRSFRVPRAMADVDPLGASPANRKKVVLLGFGGKELEVNNRLFDWANVNIVDEEDDVYVVHFTRTKKTRMGAIRTASTQRARSPSSKSPRSPRGGRLGSAESTAGWVRPAVIDAMNKRRSACHSCAASVFEVDLDAGFGTAEVRRRQ